MFIKIIFYTLALVVMAGCGSKEKEARVMSASKVTNQKSSLSSFQVNKFEGTYTGSFDRGFITLNLNYVTGQHVSGYDIQRGLRRNINGSLTPGGKTFAFNLKEPGDNASDGIFQFTIDTSRFIVNGRWKSFDTSKIVSKALVLKKQPKKTESNLDNELGTWVPARSNYRTDTTLDFSGEGICEFRFYQFPGDSTSQLLSVKGSYIRIKDSVLIEWQKNSWTPAQKMKLVVNHKPRRAAGIDEQRLVGHGWKLIKLEGD